MLPVQLDDLLKSMYDEAGIEGDQLAELRTRVRRYLDVIVVQRRVNPREVKRFINSYTLQTLIRPDLVPEAILALQTIAFRPDWHPWYEAASSRPNEFREAVQTYRRDIAEISKSENHVPESETLPPSEKTQEREKVEDAFRRFFRVDLEFSDEIKAFLGSDLISPLVEQPDLDPYLSSLQSARTPTSAVLRDRGEVAEFDVFLCYNRHDTPAVRELARQLREWGLRPWLDERQLRPGTPWQQTLEGVIASIPAVAVIVGSEVGPWQEQEVVAFLRQSVRRQRIIVPVLLPGADRNAIPTFLDGLTWVDLAASEPDPINQLAWGILGGT
jgi:TIR domain